MAYLTIPVAEKTEEQFISSIKSAAEKKPDILELRTDCIRNLTYDTLEKLITTSHSLSIPVIITCRDVKEGGMYEHSQLVRLEILCEAARLGAEYIDCEYANYLNTKVREMIDRATSNSKKGCRLILSAHSFSEPFYDATAIYQKIYEANYRAIAKLAYTATHINDCFEGFDVLKNRQGDLIVACMGEAGQIMRLSAGKTGNYLTFAAIDSDSSTAPGQPTVSQLKELYRFDSVNADTELYGIIANPVAHSASPAVYNGSFDLSHRNGLYLPLLVEGGKADFDEFMDNILSRRQLGFRGFSITIPHKTHAFDYVAKHGKIEEKAKPIGAINTISISHAGEISGYNTDYAGLLNPMISRLGQLKGKRAAIIGAGGVSKAAAAVLTASGADVTIFNRTVERAKALADTFGCKFAPGDELNRIADEDFDVVINCTSVGMSPDVNASPLSEGCITKRMTVFDTVYNPPKTMLLKYAVNKGAKVINGLEMFVEQAVEQYKLLTGDKADKLLIEKVLREKLGI
jgi:3-dehydroquinate dehydratase / shikimate dehydrogenase